MNEDPNIQIFVWALVWFQMSDAYCPSRVRALTKYFTRVWSEPTKTLLLRWRVINPSTIYWKVRFLLSTRTAMWFMPVHLTETENENDSVNQNDVAKMTLQKWRCTKERTPATLLADGITSTNNPLICCMRIGTNHSVSCLVGLDFQPVWY